MTTDQILQIEISTANACGLDPNIAVAQAIDESNQNPNARSSAGAEGLYQFLPSTWSGLHCGGSIWDPQASATCRCTYMTQLLGMFSGDYAAALAAYNWGPGRVQTAISNYGGNWLSHAPVETQNYVTKIFGLASTLNYSNTGVVAGSSGASGGSTDTGSGPADFTLQSCPSDQIFDQSTGQCVPIASIGGVAGAAGGTLSSLLSSLAGSVGATGIPWWAIVVGGVALIYAAS